MKPEKILEVLDIYREIFKTNHIKKDDYSHDELLIDKDLGLSHCHGMLDKIVVFVHQGRIEKAFRWLGFIQGVLWASGIYTLSDLMNHNRPDRSIKDTS